MKGTIKEGHIPLNKVKMIIVGQPPLTFTKISGIEEELEVVDLPDRTQASGGQTKAGEFTASIPMHHYLEQAAVELWYKESQDPVSPTYKKAGTIIYEKIDGGLPRTHSIMGVFPSKRKLPDAEMTNEGEMAEVEWTFKFDEIFPI